MQQRPLNVNKTAAQGMCLTNGNLLPRSPIVNVNDSNLRKIL